MKIFLTIHCTCLFVFSMFSCAYSIIAFRVYLQHKQEKPNQVTFTENSHKFPSLNQRWAMIHLLYWYVTDRTKYYLSKGFHKLHQYLTCSWSSDHFITFHKAKAKNKMRYVMCININFDKSQKSKGSQYIA
jgi:hypothetical protein